MSDYTFHFECDSCGQTPVLKDLGLCSVCCFGEADSMWDWIYEKWHGSELKQAQQTIKALFAEFNNDIDPMTAMLLHLTPEVGERMNEIMRLK